MTSTNGLTGNGLVDLTTSLSAIAASLLDSAPLNAPTTVSALSSRSSNTTTFDVARGGETAVTLSSDLAHALNALHIQAEGFGGTDISDGIAEFGITGGAADLSAVKVDIIHNGGLTLQAGHTTVDLTDFIITNLGGSAVLTGLVTINDNLITRASLFDLQVGSIVPPTAEGRLDLGLENVAVTLTGDAAAVLNQAFGVSAFTSGFNIGTATVDAPLRDPNRTLQGFEVQLDQAIDQFNTVIDQLDISSLQPLVSVAQVNDFLTQVNTFLDRFDVNNLFPDLDLLSAEPLALNVSTVDLLRGGETAVTLSSDLVTALGSLQVQASGFGGTDISDGIAEFGITGGAADVESLKVDIIHEGGLTLTAGTTTVDLTDFIITNLNGAAVLTGLVTVNDGLVTRAPLFNLQVGGVGTSTDRPPTLDLENVAVTLTSEAATTLNQIFSVSAFTAGFNIGTADATAPFSPPRRERLA